ncbi:MAG: hypothetical protein EOO42_05905 [Flavobacteriales bacterium]|nr:MAG: hypothetical protein EOO42_05905 [Flavobacteriales bacterium]
MKNITYILSLLILVACNNPKENKVDSQKDSVTVPATSETEPVATVPKTIEEIKSLYINTANQLEKGTLDSVAYKYNCNNERSGTVTYFSQGGSLKMVKHSYNEYDHFSATDQFFVSADTLYFVYYNRTFWSFESGQAAEGATKDDITEQRFYISNNQALQCLEKKFAIRSHLPNQPTSAQVANKIIKCNDVKPLQNEFNKLLAFQKQDNKDCLGK